MAVVVTCPGCRAMARVPDEGLGRAVVCPGCRRTFVATFAAGRPVPVAAVVPVRPPAAPDPLPPHDADPGLPASVLIGLALLPFVIPLAWLAAPVVAGRDPALSVATPLALAVSASVLSLAVVFTVDWTGPTRVKGVLILVALAYFGGATLFFLKKDMVDAAKRVLGVDFEWREHAPKGMFCTVRMPPGGREMPDHQPLTGWRLLSFGATESSIVGPHSFVIGTDDATPRVRVGRGVAAVAGGAVSEAAAADAPGSPLWFARARRAVEEGAGGEVTAERPVTQQGKHPGREWVVPLPTPGMVRVARVFVVTRETDKVHKVRVYYLAADGPNLSPDDPDPKRFFDSFHVKDGK